VRRPHTPRRSGGAARAEPRPAARRERRAGRVWRRAVFNVLSRNRGNWEVSPPTDPVTRAVSRVRGVTQLTSSTRRQCTVYSGPLSPR
jgi:hypothetical protein